jgi:GNAT superfamily N-acetyltransferase
VPAIRPATAADADAVFGLLLQLAQTYPPDRVAFDESFPTFTHGDNPNALLLVAEDATGTVRAYALTTFSRLLYTNGNSGHLQELVVDESVRGTGIGSALIERIELLCRQNSVRQLTVASRRAGGFYERLGYRSTADFLKRTFD